jgi:hypothetical protein
MIAMTTIRNQTRNNTATHKYLFEVFSKEDMNKLLFLFEDSHFQNHLKQAVSDRYIK